MTFREMYKESHPNAELKELDDNWCPSDFGYEDAQSNNFCKSTTCRECWGREFEEEDMNQTKGIKEESSKVIVRVREPESCEGITFTYDDYYDASCIIQECLKAGKIVEMEMRCE